MLAMTSAIAAALVLALTTGTDAGGERLRADSLPLTVQETLHAPVQPLRLVPAQAPTSAQEPDDGFEAISELPPDEQLPAAPMVVAAYIFVLVAFFVYVFSLSRRLAAVKQDMSRLESEVKRSTRT
jgi:hypothetical protein